jgi:hypothetical protein
MLGHEIPGRAFCQRLGLVVGARFRDGGVGPVVLGEGAGLAFASIATTEEVRTTRVTPAACVARSARRVPSTAGLDDVVLVPSAADIGKGEAV